MTPPAADGGLPGPLPWHVVPAPAADRTVVADRDGISMFSSAILLPRVMEAFVAWINAQAARLAEKDAEIARLKIQVVNRKEEVEGACQARDLSRQDAKHYWAQLATATERLASAEAVIAPFAQQATYLDAGSKATGHSYTDEAGISVRMGHLRAARAWLTPKDGEKQP